MSKRTFNLVYGLGVLLILAGMFWSAGLLNWWSFGVMTVAIGVWSWWG